MNVKGQKEEKPSVKAYVFGIFICVLFLMLGVALIRVSVVEISDALKCTAETGGNVKSVSVSSWKKSKKYNVYYSFELGGELIDDTFSTPKRIKEGQVIRIKYEPGDPDNRYIKGYSDWPGFIVIFIFGILWSALFIFLIYVIIVNAKYMLASKKKT